MRILVPIFMLIVLLGLIFSPNRPDAPARWMGVEYEALQVHCPSGYHNTGRDRNNNKIANFRWACPAQENAQAQIEALQTFMAKRGWVMIKANAAWQTMCNPAQPNVSLRSIEVTTEEKKRVVSTLIRFPSPECG